MIEVTARRNPRRRPAHPGTLLALEVLPALGRPKSEIARLLGLSRQSLHDILAGRQPVTPATAVKLGKLCGNGPRLWLNMQCSCKALSFAFTPSQQKPTFSCVKKTGIVWQQRTKGRKWESGITISLRCYSKTSDRKLTNGAKSTGFTKSRKMVTS